jgi:hypothetical protein
MSLVYPLGPAGSVNLAPAVTDSAELLQFLARITAPSGARKTAYATLIDGLVADGIWTKLDALWIIAAAAAATAHTNLKQTSFTLSAVGGVSFAVDLGYTPVTATSDYLNTNYTPTTASGNMALNSGSMGVYILTNDTAGDNASCEMGCVLVGDQLVIQTGLFSSTWFAFGCNDAGGNAAVGPGTSRGMWAISRTAASGAGAKTAYRNGSSITSAGTTSTSMVALPVFIGSNNNNGTTGQGPPNPHQYAAAFLGGGLTGAEVTTLSSRINAYMTTLGINVY